MLIHVNFLINIFEAYILKYTIKKVNIKNGWLKENNNSSSFTKPYIFDQNLANSAWTVFSLPLFNSLFETI